MNGKQIVGPADLDLVLLVAPVIMDLLERDPFDPLDVDTIQRALSVAAQRLQGVFAGAWKEMFAAEEMLAELGPIELLLPLAGGVDPQLADPWIVDHDVPLLRPVEYAAGTVLIHDALPPVGVSMPHQKPNAVFLGIRKNLRTPSPVAGLEHLVQISLQRPQLVVVRHGEFREVQPVGLIVPEGPWAGQAAFAVLLLEQLAVVKPLALRWDDVSLDKATAITRHGDNKGKRDEIVPLHPVVVEHLRKIINFGPLVFYWPLNRRLLWEIFGEIQEAAGIHLPCHEKHEHTPACHVYGFHDLRRAFATLNAPKLSGNALQALMRHENYSTTKRYINMARQLDGAVEKLHVPDVLKAAR